MSKIDDFGRHAESLLRNGSDQIAETGAALMKKIDFQSLENELKKVQLQLDIAGGRIGEKAKNVDNNIHSNPYAYIAGAFGLGFVTAMILNRPSR